MNEFQPWKVDLPLNISQRVFDECFQNKSKAFYEPLEIDYWDVEVNGKHFFVYKWTDGKLYLNVWDSSTITEVEDNIHKCTNYNLTEQIIANTLDESTEDESTDKLTADESTDKLMYSKNEFTDKRHENEVERLLQKEGYLKYDKDEEAASEYFNTTEPNGGVVSNKIPGFSPLKSDLPIGIDVSVFLSCFPNAVERYYKKEDVKYWEITLESKTVYVYDWDGRLYINNAEEADVNKLSKCASEGDKQPESESDDIMRGQAFRGAVNDQLNTLPVNTNPQSHSTETLLPTEKGTVDSEVDLITSLLNNTSVETKGERQGHGFWYEQHVIQKFNLIKADGYTSQYDAFYHDAGVIYPVQIKFIKYGGAIEMGDLKRNSTKKENFILVIGFWQEDKKKVVREDILYIDHDKYKSFVECSFHDIMASEMSEISNSYEDDNKWKIFCDKYKRMWSSCNVLEVRFKRDHKTQKRIQCAIPWRKYNDTFVKAFKAFAFKKTDLKPQ